MMSNAQIESRVKTIRRVYLSLFFVVLFVVIMGLTGLPGTNDRANLAEGTSRTSPISSLVWDFAEKEDGLSRLPCWSQRLVS
jgi:hypothetical protein